MRFRQLLVSLALGFAAACEDPTLLIGARPIDEPEQDTPDTHTTREPVGTEPGAEAALDATVVPRTPSDAGTVSLGDAELPRAPADEEEGPDFRPDMPPRPRFAYRCRGDRECARVRGVCDRGWCVQCRSFLDCPPLSVCTADRVCIRQR